MGDGKGKEIVVICKRSYKFRKKCYFYCVGFFCYLLNKHKSFLLVCTVFIKIHGEFMYNAFDSGNFHGQGHCGTKWRFHYPSTARTY